MLSWNNGTPADEIENLVMPFVCKFNEPVDVDAVVNVKLLFSVDVIVGFAFVINIVPLGLKCGTENILFAELNTISMLEYGVKPEAPIDEVVYDK